MRLDTVQGQILAKIQEKRLKTLPVYSEAEFDVVFLKREIEELKQKIAETAEQFNQNLLAQERFFAQSLLNLKEKLSGY